VNTAGATYGGLLGTDAVSVSATGSFIDKNVGAGKTVTLTSTYAGADAGNYTITGQAGTTASITPAALSVNGITAGNKVYDGTTSASVSTAGAGFTGLLGSDVVTLGATGVFSDRNVGNAKTVALTSTYGGLDAGNYIITDQATASANITPATLTYNATPASFLTGQIPTGLTGVLSGLMTGDTIANTTTGTLLWSTPATTASAAGQYAITGGGLTLVSGNYFPFLQAAGNATALTLRPGLLPQPVLDATAQLQGTNQNNGNLPRSQGVDPLSTLTVTRLASSDQDGGGEVFAGPPPPEERKTTISIGATGPSLQIIDGGLKLPPNLAGSGQ